jgi:hypothetical protein
MTTPPNALQASPPHRARLQFTPLPAPAGATLWAAFGRLCRSAPFVGRVAELARRAHPLMR